MFAEVYAVSGSPGSYAYTYIQNVSGLTFDAKYGDLGGVQFQVPITDAANSGVAENTIVEVRPNGQVVPNMWYGLDNSQTIPATDGAVYVQFSGKSIANWLGDSVVYPSTWPTVPTHNPDGTVATVIQGHSFENAYPGKIMQDLVTRATQRGGLSWLDVSTFTVAVDSAGHAWNTTLTTTYDNGTSMWTVLQDLVARHMVDFRFEKNVLKLYNYGTMPTQYTADQVLVRRGQQINELVKTVDTSIEATVVLSIGNNLTITESDPDSTLQTTIGRRREKFVAMGGIEDTTTLKALANAELSLSGHPQIEHSVGINDTSKLPWIDFQLGDYIWEDFDGNLTKVQVNQISAAQQDAGNLLVGLILGDRILSKDERTQLFIDNTLGTNGRGALIVQQDKKAPAAPTGVAATPTAYRDANGHDWAKVQVTWTSPTTNSDGTTLRDLDRFGVQYMIDNDGTWHAIGQVPADTSPLAGIVPNLPVGKAFKVRVRAFDLDNNVSAWSPEVSIASLPKYTTPPATTSQPSTQAAIQSVVISWDGKDSSGNPVDPAVAYAQVHLGTTAGFTPSATTQVGTLSDAGSVTVGGLSPSTTYYSKIVVVDKSNNTSTASAASPAVTPTQVDAGDINATARQLGSNITYVQSGTPTGAISGDLWIDTANNNVIKRFDGTTWSLYQLGPGALNISVGGGNLVTNSGFENGVSGWSAGGQNNSTLTSSTAKAYQGTKSLLCTSNAVGAFAAVNSAAAVGITGHTYTFSMWVYVPTGNPDVYFQAYGAVPTTSSATVTTKDAWVRITLTVKATSNGNMGFGPISTATAAGQIFYLDAVQVEEGDIATAYAPKPDEILPGTVTGTMIANNTITSGALNVSVGGGNILTNSNFEDGSTGWGGVNSATLAIDTGTVFYGTKSGKLTVPTNAGQSGLSRNLSGLPTNTKFVFSAWVFIPGTGGPASGVQLSIQGTGLASSVNGPYVTTTGKWFRLIQTFTTGATAGNVALYVLANNTTAGQVFYVDSLQLEYGDIATAYAPKTDEILPGTVTGTMIANNTITAGALNINVGGGNLVPNSQFSGGSSSGWSLNAGITLNNDSAISGYCAAITATAYKWAQRPMTYKANTTYTVSFYLKADAGATSSSGAGVAIEGTTATGRVGPTSKLIGSNMPTVWTRYSYTFTNGNADTTSANILLTGNYGGTTGTGNVYISNIQVEVGDVATAYAPKADELLPGTVTGTMIANNTIGTGNVNFTARSIGGITTTVAGTAPSSPVTGDIWIDSANGNVLKSWSGSAWVTNTIGSAAVNFTARSIGGITTFTQGTTPTGAVAGDLWIDTANGNVLKTFDGTTWNVNQLATSQLSGTITAAQAGFTARSIGGVTTFTQSTTPTGAINGDLWIDTGNGNILKQFDGTSWNAFAPTAGSLTGTITGSQIDNGTIDATKVSFTARSIGGTTTFTQNTTPTGAVAGDLWIDTGNGNVIKTFDGTSWNTNQLATSQLSGQISSGQVSFTARSIGGTTTFTQNTAPTGAVTGDLWIDTGNGNVLKTYNGTAWVTNQLATTQLSGTITAAQAGFTARSIGGITTTVAGTAPASPVTGDLWIDTSTGNVLKQWSGTAWVTNTIGTAAVGFTARNIGGTTTFTQGTTPAGAVNGDLWIDTANGNVVKTYVSGAWTTNKLATTQLTGTITSAQAGFTARSIGGITTTVAGTAPTSPVTGDLWIDTANGNVLKQWSGTAWVTNQVGTGAIAANAVTATQIAADTITASQIAAGAVTASEIAANTITSAQIQAGSITGDRLTANTITATQIAANAITAGQIAAGTITANEIAGHTITAAQIAAGTITSSEILAGSITGDRLTANTITATQIAANTITAAQIAANTITASQIASGTITATQIQSGSITGDRLTANTITAAQIAGDTITAAQIATGAITTAELAAGAVTAEKLTVASRGQGLVNNPSFEDTGTVYAATGTSNWNANQQSGAYTISRVVDTTRATQGSAMMKLTVTTNAAGSAGIISDRVPVVTGASYYAKLVYGATVASTNGLYFRIYWYKADGTASATPFSSIVNNVAIAVATKNTLVAEGSATAPSDAAFASLWVANYNPATATTVYADSADLQPQVVSAVIANGAITATQIATDTITAGQIAANAITTSELNAGAVTAAKIASHTITANEIAANTITATEIAANTITAAQIAANTITASQIAAGTITTNEIAANTITAADIHAGTITSTEIASQTIVAGNIATGTITATQIAGDTITAAQIAANAIGTNELAANAVTAAKIAANTITAAQIAANTITANEIAANTITAGQIAANTITANEIAADAITTSELAAGAVTAAEIAAGAITADKINLTLASNNICPNPDFENNLDGYANFGSATNALSLDRAFNGVQSCKVTFATNASTSGLSYTFNAKASTTYTFSYYVYMPTANAPASGVKMQIQGAVNATFDSGYVTSPKDSWVRITGTVTSNGTGGSIFLYLTANNTTAGQYVYLDAVQIEVGSTATPFILAAIKSSQQAAHVEFNGKGFYAYDSTGTQTIAISDEDGSVTVSGTIQVPSNDAFATNNYPGQTTLDQDGLTQSARATINKSINSDPSEVAGLSAGPAGWEYVMGSDGSSYVSTGGTWKIGFRGVWSAALADNASYATVQSALNGLSTVTAAGLSFVVGSWDNNAGAMTTSSTAGFRNGGFGYIYQCNQNRWVPYLEADMSAITLSSPPAGVTPYGIQYAARATSGPEIKGAYTHYTTGLDAVVKSTNTIAVDAIAPSSSIDTGFYNNTPIHRLFGSQGVRYYNTTQTGNIQIPVGAYLADSTAGNAKGGVWPVIPGNTTLTPNLKPNTTYVLSWHILRESLSGANFDYVWGLLDGSQVKIYQKNYNTLATTATLATGISGVVRSVSPERTLFTGELPVIDRFASNNTGLDQNNGHGFTRYFLTFTTPASMTDCDLIWLQLPTPVLNTGAVDNSVAFYLNGIQLEEAGVTGSPTLFVDYADPNAAQVWAGGGARRNVQPLLTAPTFADTTLSNNVTINKVRSNLLVLGNGVASRKSLEVVGQADFTGTQSFSFPHGDWHYSFQGTGGGTQNGRSDTALAKTSDYRTRTGTAAFAPAASKDPFTYGNYRYCKQAGFNYLQGYMSALNAGVNLFQLPSDYCPDYKQVFGVWASGGNAAKVNVSTAGEVYLSQFTDSGVSHEISFAGISYPCDSDISPSQWTLVGTTAIPFSNGWTHYTGTVGAPYTNQEAPCRFYVDEYGVVHLNGLIKGGTTGQIFVLPTGYRPETPKNFIAVAYSSTTTCGTARVRVDPSGIVELSSFANAGTNGFVSLSGLSFVSSQAGSVYGSIADADYLVAGTDSMANAWVSFGSGYASLNAYRDFGGMIRLGGLIKSGNLNLPIASALPVWMRPSQRLIFPVNTNTAFCGRADVFPDGTITIGTLGGGTNGFVSLDGIAYFPDT